MSSVISGNSCVFWHGLLRFGFLLANLHAACVCVVLLSRFTHLSTANNLLLIVDVTSDVM